MSRIRTDHISPEARHLWFIADQARRPQSGVVVFAKLVYEFGLGEGALWDCFEELYEAGIVTLSGKATVIPFEGERPCVGRLPWHIWSGIRDSVFKRDSRTCRYCGATDVPLECDHIVPITRRGSNDLENLAAACVPCNRAKRDKLLSEWKFVD